MHGSIETAFIGRLGQDPELRTSQAGKAWARLSVAVGNDDETQPLSDSPRRSRRATRFTSRGRSG
jgi:single-stranded DNA-binding protein